MPVFFLILLNFFRKPAILRSGSETIKIEENDPLQSQKDWHRRWSQLRQSLQDSDLDNAIKVDENNEVLQPLEKENLVHDSTKNEQDKLLQTVDVHPENALKVDTTESEHDIPLQPIKGVIQENVTEVHEATELEQNEDLQPVEDVNSENSSILVDDIVIIDQNDPLQPHQVNKSFELSVL